MAHCCGPLSRGITQMPLCCQSILHTLWWYWASFLWLSDLSGSGTEQRVKQVEEKRPFDCGLVWLLSWVCYQWISSSGEMQSALQRIPFGRIHAFLIFWECFMFPVNSLFFFFFSIQLTQEFYVRALVFKKFCYKWLKVVKWFSPK